MIYRILADQQEGVWDEQSQRVVWRPSGTRLRGAFTAGISGGLGDIPYPRIQNPRARFYFTELGWQKYGRFLYDSATQQGHTVRVIRRKNPEPSQVIYRDPYQVAILPRKRER
jgi:hypothetical protein